MKNLKKVVYVILILISLTGCVSTKLSKCSRLYIGTNDKDTYKIEIPLDKQKQKLLQIITEYTSGVTVYEADGLWKDEKQNVTTEKTFICEFFDISEENLKKITFEILKEFNQNSILYIQSDCKVFYFNQINSK